jgi:two-component system sensor histidine kinase QseC
MKRSIQKHMLVTTLTLFMAVWTITLVSSYFSLLKQSRLSHDQDLKNYALIIQGFSHRLIVDSEANGSGKSIEEELTYEYDISMAFNISYQGKLIAKSIRAPYFPSIDSPGVTSIDLGKSDESKTWRVYRHYNETDDIWITVGETSEFFNKLLYTVILQTVWPILAFLPLMLFAIILGVRQSLKPLKALAYEVEKQTPKFLNTVEIGDVPQEVESLVHSLNLMLERLKVAFENEHAFTANAAHELRTPLAALKTEAQTLQMYDIPQDALKAVKRIEVRVDRATHLVSQLLTLARVEADKHLKKVELFYLDDVVLDVISESRQEAEQKSIELNFPVPNKESITGEPFALNIMIRNLLDNAIRYSPPNSKVDISLEVRSTTILLSVTDNGPGLSDELKAKVFKKFFRTANSIESGVGLGLSIVHRIAHLHNATINLADARGHSGLRVEVIFPKAV